MAVFPAAGLEVLEPIGAGENGGVFLVETREGRRCALKILDARVVDLAAMRMAFARLEKGGWPARVLPVLAAELDEEPVYLLTELEDVRHGSLQDVDFSEPHADAGAVVRTIARGLAEMHAKGVAHANLKPSNVFLRDDDIWLADWAMGNVKPGMAFTDAVLYQAPEQLEEPVYDCGEEGFRRDVYAFGALSYRLLTGKFPRCHKTFSLVTPAPGEFHKEGICADFLKVAANVRAHQRVEWEEDFLDKRMRGIIDRCLDLESGKRPRDMMQVAGELGVWQHEMGIPAGEKRGGKRSSRRAVYIGGGFVVAVLALGGLWRLAVSQLNQTRAERDMERQRLSALRTASAAEIAEAQARATLAEQAARYARELAETRLETSRIISDRLFEWGMEKGRRDLPALEGRMQRLAQLERYYQDVLERIKGDPRLEEETMRVKLQLAEVSIAAGDAQRAGQRLADAMSAWEKSSPDGGMKMRLATDSLLLALSHYARGDSEAEAAFAAAREKLTAARGNGVDETRREQLLAILDYHEAKLFSSRGEDAKALEQLMRATQSLRKLAAESPEAAILRSELAACHLSSATILEAMGNLGDAREVRLLASAELIKLLNKNPKDISLRLDLAGCYGGIAEAAVLSGDVGAADQMGESAMKVVDGILLEQPDNAQALAIKAAQLGLRAGLRRERGPAVEAAADLDEGIRLLEGMRASSPAQALVSYRLALLYWQKGRMLGGEGNREEEARLLRMARSILAKLEGSRNEQGPRDEQVRLSSAYMLGDLGHSLDLAGHLDEAKRTFEEAIAVWETLLSSRPQSEEYSEGLEWCRRRVKNLNEAK